MRRYEKQVSGWRPCPFVADSRYRVRESFASLRDKFAENEVLTYQRAVYSRYDGMTGYLFLDAAGNWRSFDVDDADPEGDFLESVERKFEPLAG
jgi:hypothetical protein